MLSFLRLAVGGRAETAVQFGNVVHFGVYAGLVQAGVKTIVVGCVRYDVQSTAVDVFLHLHHYRGPQEQTDKEICGIVKCGILYF